MIQQLLDHIRRHQLFQPDDRVLLAVSGGVDSMVMLHVLHAAGFTQLAVAHVNFQLRGEDSRADEALVQSWCAAHHLPCHVHRADTERYADAHGLSIQMAARDLRYTFFHDLCQQHGYAYIATAHHLQDSFETVLLNLTRGTGMDGIAGIAVRQGNIVRPMLFATREQITAYATEHQIAWREDRSNLSTDYARNAIRLQVMPILRSLNPGLDHHLPDTLQRLAATQHLAKAAVANLREHLVEQQGDFRRIHLAPLLAQADANVILWEIIKPFGFNFRQCRDMIAQHQSGACFHSGTHKITVDRDALLVTPLQAPATISRLITDRDTRVEAGGLRLRWRIVPASDYTLVRSGALLQLDADAVVFPVTWRTWQPGDAFQPLGMSHMKKVSDFLIDAKVSLPNKARTTVVVSSGQIIGLPGHRPDQRYRVTPHTQRVLVMEIAPATDDDQAELS